LLETFELTQEQVAERLSMSRPAVTNALRLLALPENIQDFLRMGSMSAGHARALAAVEDSALQTSIARRVVDNGLSVREVEHLVKRSKISKEQLHHSTPPKSIPEFKELEDRLMHSFGTKARVKGTLDRGTIVLEYYNRQDLERVYELVLHLYEEKEGKQKHN
jgi:ParB family chromosome partitioning protein